MVQLHGRLFLYGRDDHHLIEYSYILTNDTQRDSNHEWRLHTSCNPQPDTVFGYLRSLRYEAG